MKNELQNRLDSLYNINFLSDRIIDSIIYMLPENLKQSSLVEMNQAINNFINIDFEEFKQVMNYIKNDAYKLSIVNLSTFNFGICIDDDGFYLSGDFADATAPCHFTNIESLYDFLKNYNEI